MLSKGQLFLIGIINIVILGKLVYDFFTSSVGIFQGIFSVVVVIYSLNYIGSQAIKSGVVKRK